MDDWLSGRKRPAPGSAAEAVAAALMAGAERVEVATPDGTRVVVTNPPPAQAVPPPAQQAAPPQAVPPPAQQAALTTDSQLFAFLGQHIRPREDCARCAVARTDPLARTSFGDASEVGNGRTRNMDLSRACPLAAHGINKRQITELLSFSPLPPMAKRAKAAQFMQETYDMTPLGKNEGVKPFLVSLYNQDAGGQYEVAARQTDFYQGFERF
jgi:hypothetical protein